MSAARQLLAVVALGLVVSGCEGFKEQRGRGDAPVGRGDDSPAEVLQMPDLFPNVAHKCDGHGNRVYVTQTKDTNALVIVPNQPSCVEER